VSDRVVFQHVNFAAQVPPSEHAPVCSTTSL